MSSQDIFGTYELKINKTLFSKIEITKDSTCILYSYQVNEEKNIIIEQKGFISKIKNNIFLHFDTGNIIKFELIFKKNKLFTISNFRRCAFSKSKKTKLKYSKINSL